MKPLYIKESASVVLSTEDVPTIPIKSNLNRLMDEVSWLESTETRKECMMALIPSSYTYGSGNGVRTYQSVEYNPFVLSIQNYLNIGESYTYNVCFLNRYDNEKNHLGWHADNFVGMDQDHPIAVVSFGAPREIWWRENGHKGAIPLDQRQLLGDSSLFIMPPGFQQKYQHKIPKHDKPCGPRISLTFRKFK